MSVHLASDGNECCQCKALATSEWCILSNKHIRLLITGRPQLQHRSKMYTALEHTKTQLFTSLTIKLIIKADKCQYD